jgi:predicted DCC family thiol-disulfide oxidoreductase YuxK
MCNLCTSAVRVLRVLDQKQQIEYVPSQELGVSLRNQYTLTDVVLQGGMHIITEEGRLVSGALALSEVCRLLSPIGFICDILAVPEFQRLYGWIASHRYRLFGCRDACFVADKVIL